MACVAQAVSCWLPTHPRLEFISAQCDGYRARACQIQEFDPLGPIRYSLCRPHLVHRPVLYLSFVSWSPRHILTTHTLFFLFAEAPDMIVFLSPFCGGKRIRGSGVEEEEEKNKKDRYKQPNSFCDKKEKVLFRSQNKTRESPVNYHITATGLISVPRIEESTFTIWRMWPSTKTGF